MSDNLRAEFRIKARNLAEEKYLLKDFKNFYNWNAVVLEHTESILAGYIEGFEDALKTVPIEQVGPKSFRFKQ